MFCKFTPTAQFFLRFRLPTDFRNEHIHRASKASLPRRACPALQRPSAVRRSHGLCGWFGGTELYTRADPQEKRARALARVRPAEIRDAARRVLLPERLSVTAVGALSPSLSRKVEKIVTEFA